MYHESVSGWGRAPAVELDMHDTLPRRLDVFRVVDVESSSGREPAGVARGLLQCCQPQGGDELGCAERWTSLGRYINSGSTAQKRAGFAWHGRFLMHGCYSI